MNNIVKTQQILDQISEKNKHLKSENETIEIEEDYLVELLEIINNLCEVNKILQDKFELSQKLISVLQEKLKKISLKRMTFSYSIYCSFYYGSF